MFNKIIHSLITIVLVIVVAMFIYKKMNTPKYSTASLSSEAGKHGQNNSSAIIKPEDLKNQIEEILVNNPEIIIKSLESMQKKKMQEMNNLATDFLKDNINSIKTKDTPPIIGSAKDSNYAVMFYDYNCGFCKKAQKVIDELIETEDIQIILRPMPILSENSIYLTKLALVVHKMNPEKFADFHNDLMNLSGASESKIQELMQKYEIDEEIVKNEINTQWVKQAIDTNMKFAKSLGIRGAPSYIVNGQFVAGFMDIKKFKTLINSKQK